MATNVAKPPPGPFNLVKAAEALLASAKKLVETTTNGATPDSGLGGHTITSTADSELNLRRGIVIAAKKIAFEVAPPADIFKSEWTVLSNVAAWNIFMEWKVFDHIPLGDSAGISFADLAKAVDAQENLIARIATVLVSHSTLVRGTASHPTRITHVAHSRISPFYRSDHPAGPLAVVATGNGFKPYAQWPSYFSKYGRREPPHVTYTPFSFGWGHPELPPWEVKALYPEYASAFTKAMKSRAMVGGGMRLTGPEALYDLSWVGAEAAADAKREAVVVDVGGGLGQLLLDVVREIPAISPAQCVLQDRKEVIAEAAAIVDPVLQQVRKMDHDFHTEQPVKGAAVYLLRRILLDYPDELAVGILKRLADAMAEGDAKTKVVIIEERLMDEPMPLNRMVDMVMLNLGGKLRDERGFAEIAGRAGLVVKGYYFREGDPNVVVECARE